MNIKFLIILTMIIFMSITLSALGQNAKDFYNEGEKLFQSFQIEEAINFYKKAIEKDSNFYEAYYKLGQAIILSDGFIISDKTNEGIKYLLKAISKKIDYIDAWLFLGVTFDHIGNYEDAIECLKTVLRYDPKNYNACFNLGVVYEKQKKFELALKTYEEAIKIDSERYEAWNNKGSVLEQLGKIKESQECFDKANKLKK